MWNLVQLVSTLLWATCLVKVRAMAQARAGAQGGGAQCAGARRCEVGRAALVLEGRQSDDGHAPPDPRDKRRDVGGAQRCLSSKGCRSSDVSPIKKLRRRIGAPTPPHTTAQQCHRQQLCTAGGVDLRESITLWPLPIWRPSESAGRSAEPCLRFMKPTIVKFGR